MKEMNDWQLRSWVPRRPSAKLRERIFALEGKAERPLARVRLAAQGGLPRLTFLLKPASFRWLAPVTAALFLTCILLNQRSAPMAVPASSPLIAMILSSNQSAAAYLP